MWNPWSGAQISYIKGQYTHALPLPLLSSLVATADATFSVFENKKGTLRHARTLKALSAPIISVEYLTRLTLTDPNVVTVCSDGSVSMWDTRTWDCINSFEWKRTVYGSCVTADEISVRIPSLSLRRFLRHHFCFRFYFGLLMGFHLHGRFSWSMIHIMSNCWISMDVCGHLSPYPPPSRLLDLINFSANASAMVDFSIVPLR